MFLVRSRMAMNLISVQASSVASESAFSTSGRVLSIRRTKLTSTSLEMCMCLKDHLDAKERKQDKFPLKIPLDFDEDVFDDEVQRNEAILLSDEEIALDASSEGTLSPGGPREGTLSPGGPRFLFIWGLGKRVFSRILMLVVGVCYCSRCSLEFATVRDPRLSLLLLATAPRQNRLLHETLIIISYIVNYMPLGIFAAVRGYSSVIQKDGKEGDQKEGQWILKSMGEWQDTITKEDGKLKMGNCLKTIIFTLELIAHKKKSLNRNLTIMENNQETGVSDERNVSIKMPTSPPSSKKVAFKDEVEVATYDKTAKPGTKPSTYDANLNPPAEPLSSLCQRQSLVNLRQLDISHSRHSVESMAWAKLSGSFDFGSLLQRLLRPQLKHYCRIEEKQSSTIQSRVENGGVESLGVESRKGEKSSRRSCDRWLGRESGGWWW
nr:zinc finger BED domain-containing protein RICESLEEPER 3 [Tanacetum cinerariifolium]